MNPVSFRAIFDDGTIWNWEDPIVVDGVEKPASIDDVDRSTLSNLCTVLADGTVASSLGFSSEERTNKLAIWRHFAGIVNGEKVTMGALMGYNEHLSDGATKVTLTLIKPDGTTSDASDQEITLHPREIFE